MWAGPAIIGWHPLTDRPVTGIRTITRRSRLNYPDPLHQRRAIQIRSRHGTYAPGRQMVGIDRHVPFGRVSELDEAERCAVLREWRDLVPTGANLLADEDSRSRPARRLGTRVGRYSWLSGDYNGPPVAAFPCRPVGAVVNLVPFAVVACLVRRSDGIPLPLRALVASELGAAMGGSQWTKAHCGCSSLGTRPPHCSRHKSLLGRTCATWSRARLRPLTSCRSKLRWPPGRRATRPPS